MRAWIFQASPDQFDIDGYLATAPVEFLWLVTRYGNEIQLGDRIYLWRAQGTSGAIAGVVAEAEVVAPTGLRIENADAVPFWTAGSSEASSPKPRVILRLIRAARSREVIRREWCQEDPILRELPNLRMAAGTNYPLSLDHAERLAALWSRTGHDWSRSEAVAGLWAYAKTFGDTVSRLPSSPIAEVSVLIGRAVSGVYNKVMNFRHLDPRDGRAGMSGASDVDGRVWNEFYNAVAGDLRISELEAEFNRLWGREGSLTGADARSEIETIDEQARALEKEDLTLLFHRYTREVSGRGERPRVSPATTRIFQRSAVVVAIARVRADNKCEVPDCEHPAFVCPDGRPYSEVHHIVPLADGGPDVPANVACLCPSHHREAHVGSNANKIAAALRALRADECPPVDS